MIDPLFQPISIGSVSIKNRIFMPAMHLCMCQNFAVTEQLVEFYRRRATGGAGLISVGYATVDELSGNPTNIGAHDDCFLPGLARLAGVIQAGGARAAVQLNHAGRYNHSMLLGGKKPIAPSAIASRLTRETPKEMDVSDIVAVRRSFVEAAKRVCAAGFDMVEILAGTGYLISEFLSPLTNTRDDEYGGSLANRMRFGLEVVGQVRSELPDVALLVRVNGNDFMKGGSGQRELQEFGSALVEAGADGLCVNVGWHEAQVPQIVTKVPRGVFAYFAKELKKRVNVPVIASHRINDPATARKLIGEGYCDMVAMGRSLIADPDLPVKAEKGEEGSILHCVACGQGCFDNIVRMKPVECLCNPEAGHEVEMTVVQTSTPQKIMVVGGGPAGINSALAASSQGHQVFLYERKERLGGQLWLAGSSPGREEFQVLARDWTEKIENSSVTIMTGVEVDAQLLAAEKPDAVIIATGGEPITPGIPGVEAGHVCQAWEVLQEKYLPGNHIVVIGGGAVGVETALMLAEQGTLSGEELKFLLLHEAESIEELQRLALEGSKKVTLIEMIDKIGTNFGKTTRWGMLQDISRYNVKVKLQAKVLQIADDHVEIETVAGREKIRADGVVLAVGTRSSERLSKVADELGIPCQVVGDAKQPATVLEATHQGFRAGRVIL